MESGYLNRLCLRPLRRVTHAVPLSTRIPSQGPGSDRRWKARGFYCERPGSERPDHLYTWRKQELVDTGVEAGLTTIEADELRTAKRKIKDLETELAVTRRANELLKEQVVSPRGGLRRSR